MNQTYSIPLSKTDIYDIYPSKLEAVRHYEVCKDVDGSGAPLLDIRRDDIEIVNVMDFDYGDMSFPAIVDKLNYYGKHNNPMLQCSQGGRSRRFRFSFSFYRLLCFP